jgi:DNA-binding MarR family transcriptional regulator
MVDYLDLPRDFRFMTKRIKGLAARQAENFGHVLLECARRFDQLGQARLNAKLGEEIARPSVMRLVPHMPPDGIRPTELARRADISKQAVGQTLAFLEEHGLVEYAPDPSDGRAFIVRMTDFGVEASLLGLEALAQVQREVEQSVGREVVEQTFAGLRQILASLAARQDV